jgi:hypothetical protein
MSIQNKKQYFTENLVQTLSKPVITGALVVSYSYYMGRNQYSNSLTKYAMRGGLAAGSSLISRFATSKIPISSNEGIKSIEHMLLEPIICSAVYAISRKSFDNSNDYMTDGLVCGAANVGAGYLVSPIDRFFS